MGQSTVELVKQIVDDYGYHEPKEGPLQASIRYLDKEYLMNGNEVSKAFKAAAEDRLGIELKTVFSVKEIIRIMNAYKGDKQKTYEPQKDKEPTPTELDLIEKDFKKALVREFNKFKIEGSYCLSPGYSYHWLEQKGLIEMGFDKSDSVKQRAMEISMAQVKGELGSFKDKNLLADFEQGTLKGNAMAIWQTKCQAVALEKFFQKMIEQNTDFEQTLNKLL